jgi:hypothetical protein
LLKTSLFTCRDQYFFIRVPILPTNILYSSPHPHLKSVQHIHYFLFIVHVSQPQLYRPHQYLDYPLFHISLQIFCRKFL